MKCDFSGYATKNDLKCSDGRIIRHGAFQDCDGKKVPLVWQHRHDSIDNVLGHAVLEAREDGIYAYCTTNDSEHGRLAKSIVQHGDIGSLSIFANQLQQKGSNVIHGVIREVSLVLAGSNPGAMIDNLQFAHSDGTYEMIDDEAIMYTPEPIILGVAHSEEGAPAENANPFIEETEETEAKMAHAAKAEPTIGEIIDGLSDEQREAVASIVGVIAGEGELVDGAQDSFESLSEQQKMAIYAIVGEIVSEDNDETNRSNEPEDEEASEGVKHSDPEGEIMKYNAFDTSTNKSKTLAHADIDGIFAAAKANGGGSLKDAVLAHGITDISVLFPEAQTLSNQPALLSRPMDWVDKVLNATHKSPFSRVKSVTANVTMEEARARGYIKGNEKVEEHFGLLKRTTDPQTIYKFQKLDRDDIVDIDDFDVVVFMKNEMRAMLNEELARAILIGDGRPAGSEHKITEDHIRPVWTDNEMYTVHTIIDASLTGSARAKAFIDAVIRARKYYKGTGSPTLYVGGDLLTEMRLIRDGDGYRLYKNDQELADELRVSEIVEIELFDDQSRMVNGSARNLGGIIVNLADYNIGATKGGEVTLFDDFDLNFNKYEYLIETRCSGALTKPMSALAFEFAANEQTVRYYPVLGVTGEEDPSENGWYELSADNGYVRSTDNELIMGKGYYVTE